MKIALVSSASTHLMRWANALSERGHDVTVILCKNQMPYEKVKFNNNIKFVKLKFAAPLGYYLNSFQLKRIIKKGNFDIVNVHYASGYGTLARRAKLKNALLNIWGSDVYDFPYQSAFNMRVIKKNLLYFKYLASTSNCMASQAKKFVNREFFITPFGVDTNVFKPIEELKSKERIVFGTVKAYSPIYRIDDTIKAFSSLIERLDKEGRTDISEKLVYEIYGKGEQEKELQSLINKLGMRNKIKLCGYIENCRLPSILNTFTVFNCNSISESFGVAAVEAMACGIAVQASDADGFAEVVEDGITGLLAPKGDVDAISENMYTLLMNAELREKIGKAGVERVKKLYDWHDNVDLMENIYNEMIEDN